MHNVPQHCCSEIKPETQNVSNLSHLQIASSDIHAQWVSYVYTADVGSFQSTVWFTVSGLSPLPIRQKGRDEVKFFLGHYPECSDGLGYSVKEILIVWRPCLWDPLPGNCKPRERTWNNRWEELVKAFDEQGCGGGGKRMILTWYLTGYPIRGLGKWLASEEWRPCKSD